MTDPIAAKAEALWAKRPELRPTGKDVLQYTDRGWRLTYYGFVSDDLAHMLIEAACWRALPDHLWHKSDSGGIKMFVDSIDGAEWIGVDEPSLTEALIAACMEAGQ